MIARRVLRAAAFLLGALLLGELLARSVLSLRLGASFLRPDDVLFHFYPELRRAAGTPTSRSDGTADVLLLGGSALHEKWGPVAPLLSERLILALGRPVRVFNLAREGHMSLDSRIKYERLAERPYDLVIYYHGINDARANNVPPEMFDPDYRQFTWYRHLHALRADRALPYAALPFAARYGAISLSGRFGGRHLSGLLPRRDYLSHGAEIKTAGPFRANLVAVADLAARKGDPLLVMTFALHVAPGYTDERFRSGALAYLRHLSPLAIWGTPENVARAVEAHNGVVRELARARPEVRLVDQDALMPREARYWNDACHLTVDGSVRFVEILLPAALEALTGGSPTDRGAARGPDRRRRSG